MKKVSFPPSVGWAILLCLAALIIMVPTLVLAQTGGTVSINAGGSATGSFGADQYFTGGNTYTNTRTIDTSQITTNPPPAAIFSTERYGAMTYTLPNRSGAQTVTLYFAETYVTAAGQRLFNVSINGSTVLSSFDIYASAGGADRAIARTFNTTANASGQVVIQFTAVTQSPKINGISVDGSGANPTQVPSTGVPPTSVPPAGVSINAGGSATGSFLADQYYSGGSTYTNSNTIDTSQVGSVPAAVFQSERYGAMTYTIPNRTAGSAQTVTLYFAETYLTAAGQRLFNVSINGSTVLSSFDIYASAGGQNRAIARSFNITANSSGQVVIQFIAGTENPKVNGITVAGGSVNPTQVPPTGVPPTGVPPTSIPPTAIPGSGVSINAGGSATGSFLADQYYSGGSTYTNSNTIDTSQVGSVPAAVFNTERYGAMTYTIPNRTAGSAQTVTLYFAETYLTAAGQRLFNVSINGSTVLSSFDIYASAGGQNRAIARSFNTTANSSGQVVIQFIAGTENPKVNGITVAGGSVSGFTLTVTKAGSGSGTVSSNPAGVNCGSTCSASFASGASVTLTATTTSGSTFGGWGGACSGTGTCTVNMNTNQTVTATFNGSSVCQIGTTLGKDVAVIGDSFIALSHGITRQIESRAKAAGSLAQNEQYVDNSVSGSTLAGSNQIPSQYTRAVQSSGTIRFVLMDGGGNDCLINNNADAAYTAAQSLFQTMAQNGTEKVVYFFYPDPVGSNYASLKTCLDGLRPRMKALCDGLTAPKCYWLDLRPLWSGHPEYTSDGIHPTDAGSSVTGDAVWDVMKTSCVAQ